MSAVNLDLRIAEPFEPLWFQSARYKGAWGGRGSGKSHDRAQHLVYRMLTEPGLRVCCVREVQNSIKDSVHQLLSDWIQRLGVGHLFDVLEKEIRGPGGSLCIFKGMKDQNAETIKSLEGVSVVWWEEAQTASDKSLRLLRPTVRAPGSELWFTWNPRKKSDPIDVFLRQSSDDGQIVVRSNWQDNPWFPADLELERQRDLRGDAAMYAHVWEGAYEPASDMQFIAAPDVWSAREAEAISHPHDELVLGVDVARGGDDRSVIYVRRGRDARSHKAEVYASGHPAQRDTMQLAARVASMIDEHKPDGVFVDEGGVGGGVIDRLRQLNYAVTAINSASVPDGLTRVKCANKRAEMWQRMKEWLSQPGIALPDTDEIEVDLTGPLYKYDANNAILLEKKEDMKKRGVRSPDLGDALALTFAYPVVPRGELDRQAERFEHDNPYEPFSWRR